MRGQTLKDYVLFPLLSGPSFPFVLAGNATANLARNLWAFTIIFCGHFPEGTQEFTEEEAENETRGEWYYRQLLGSANLTGGKLFHILAGNLSYQIEHHLFPDLPAHRYAEISLEVSEICERYGIPYNTGPLRKQFGSVVRKIVKLALPPLPGRGGSRARPGQGRPGAAAGASVSGLTHMSDTLDELETRKDTIQVVVEQWRRHRATRGHGHTQRWRQESPV